MGVHFSSKRLKLTALGHFVEKIYSKKCFKNIFSLILEKSHYSNCDFYFHQPNKFDFIIGNKTTLGDQN